MLIGGCGGQQGHSGMSNSRLGSFPIQNLDVDDEKAKYDGATHILTSPDTGMKVYFPGEPGAIPHKYEIHEGNSLNSVDYQGWYRFLLPGDKLDLAVLFIPGSVYELDDVEQIRAGANKCLTATEKEFGFVESSRQPISAPIGLSYGIEAQGKLASGTDVFKLHLLINKNGTAYKLLALGADNQVNGPEANKFLDSLVVSQF